MLERYALWDLPNTDIYTLGHSEGTRVVLKTAMDKSFVKGVILIGLRITLGKQDLQGEYDNQTPVYYTRAIELANSLIWKKQNLKFVYFEKAGHALDPRKSPEDLVYSIAPLETFHKIAKEISKQTSEIKP